MELNADLETYFERLQTICNLKENVSVRDENERLELLYLGRMIRLEIISYGEEQEKKIKQLEQEIEQLNKSLPHKDKRSSHD